MGKDIIRIYDRYTKELIKKQCTKCKKLRKVSEFFRDKRHSDGLRSNCKTCCKIKMKDYRKANENKIIGYHKEYYESNRDNIMEYHKKYMKKRRKTHKYKEYLRRYKKTDRYKEKCKKYREANKENIKEYMKEWRQTSEGKEVNSRKKHKYRAKKKGNGGSYTKEQWKKCLEYFDYKDAYTGKSLESTEVEHVIPISKGGTSNIYNLVPANKSTNCSKGGKDLFEWYSKQEYFDWNRYIKICLWIIKSGRV